MNNPKPTVAGKKTVVEEGTEFRGSLNSKCPIEVKGFVEGELVAPALTVSTTGAVHGKVKVSEIVSEGEIAGEFDAEIVRLSGVVKDNTVIRARSLEVKLAPTTGKMQVIFGECELEVGDERPKARSARPSRAPSTHPSARPASVDSASTEADIEQTQHTTSSANGSIPPHTGPDA